MSTRLIRQERKVEKTTAVKIVWNGMGGELDSAVVELNQFADGEADLSTTKITEAMIRMLRGNIVTPGDSFTITEIVE
jgi:hypothetical protein